MNDHNDFEYLVKSILSSEAVFDGALVSLTFDDSSVDLQIISKLLMDFGMTTTPNVYDNDLIISLSSGSFSNDSCLYSSLDAFWLKCRSNKKVPEMYFILKERISSLNKDQRIDSIDIHLKWDSVLLGVANHTFQNKYVIYIPNDDGGKELVLSSYDRLDSILSVQHSKSSNDSAEQMLKILGIKDAQSPERKNIIRTAIFDLTNANETKDISSVILSGERIYNRYNDLLELYTNRFSVNKIISEIEQKNLEYTTKINDFVSSSQGKAFTIPGALIAVGGLAKTSGFWDSLLIFVGLYLVYYITLMSNQVLDESYVSLKRSLTDSFSRYSKFDEGIEVKETAKKILTDLYLKIDNARVRLEKINGIGQSMLWMGGIYLLIKMIISGNA